MTVTAILQALGLFTVTNIDNIIILSLFFGRDRSQSGTTSRIMIGQYLGFLGTLGVAILAAVSAQLLPSERLLPYFGLVPLGLGLWAAWQTWRDRDKTDAETRSNGKRVSVWTVAAVTFANGGDNISVFAPVFMTVSWNIILIYCVVFLLLTPVMVLVARWITSRKPIAKVLDRWDDILYPTVLIALGLFILLGGGALLQPQ